MFVVSWRLGLSLAIFLLSSCLVFFSSSLHFDLFGCVFLGVMGLSYSLCFMTLVSILIRYQVQFLSHTIEAGHAMTDLDILFSLTAAFDKRHPLFKDMYHAGGDQSQNGVVSFSLQPSPASHACAWSLFQY
ncbi:hypothetical protein B0T26DRAFT_38797 [Lasiosphaeria miniovina]|uniref:Uncharacterized protein n=1 Tax=Lasiosphaeria miniovina TaxID=1954250 RepID=A0AA40EBF6_9PEZI|nr:uncharacterized protein B0T26DRAFT_38797 [Lasiosphaeria miniovina]KAK0733835.1 hypothetical protein B0T26DRAFT_38797 [Lasiosphaeria miniovina]